VGLEKPRYRDSQHSKRAKAAPLMWRRSPRIKARTFGKRQAVTLLHCNPTPGGTDEIPFATHMIILMIPLDGGVQLWKI
jgi:hypothetical protein